MAPLTRKQMETLSKVFEKYALEDQRNYYKNVIQRHRKAAQQVNVMRAGASLIAGVAAALSGLVVQSVYVSSGRCTVDPILPEDQSYCSTINVFIRVLMVLAVIAPAIGGALTTLADLYQWDRLIKIYDDATKNLAVADARSPLDLMDDTVYLASMRAFSEGTLSVMSDEAAQWGQMIRSPEQIQTYLANAQARAQALKPAQPPSMGQPKPPTP